ncbi:hypothetical protein ABT236_03905 [Streptomyces sp. NPDC001523]|uniref:hypothetical protein n=1 Tax=Streptomyces sp. NPDC001523 TaxID=3154383 RepID=UPI003325538A
MRTATSQPAVERAATAFVALTGAASTVLLVTQDHRAPGTPAWLLPALAVLGASVPLITMLVRPRPSHRVLLVAFPLAAACHSAVVGAADGGLPLKLLLGLSIAVSLLVCVRVTLLRAEASENRPRNRF